MSEAFDLPMFDETGRPDPTLDGTLVRRGAADTSRAAALRAFPRSGTARGRVLMLLRNMGGLTDEEICKHLAMPPNTERPRRVELVSGGWVRDSGRRRPSSTGSDSIVWEAI